MHERVCVFRKVCEKKRTKEQIEPVERPANKHQMEILL